MIAHACNPRRYEQLRRVLTLVDEMAALRRYHTTATLTRYVNDRMATSYSSRTINRDLNALRDLGLVEHDGGWRLNLRRSESIQCAAIVVID